MNFAHLWIGWRVSTLILAAALSSCAHGTAKPETQTLCEYMDAGGPTVGDYVSISAIYVSDHYHFWYLKHRACLDVELVAHLPDFLENQPFYEMYYPLDGDLEHHVYGTFEGRVEEDEDGLPVLDIEVATPQSVVEYSFP